MKQLTCEVCGGNDLIKQDGVFVCQSCGCKYSADEVKKLMVQITESVKIKGINTIDDEIKNVYALIKMKNIGYAERVLKELEQKAPRNPYVWLANAALIYNKLMVFDKSPKSVAQKCSECKRHIDCYYENAVNYADNKEQIKSEFDIYYQALLGTEKSSNNQLKEKLSSINLSEYGCYEWNQWEDRYDRIFSFLYYNNNLYYFTNNRTISISYTYTYKYNKSRGGSSCSPCAFLHKIDSIDASGNIKYASDKFVLLDDRFRRGTGRIVRITSNECCKKGERNNSSVVETFSGYSELVKKCVNDEPIRFRIDDKDNLFVVDRSGKEYQLNKKCDCKPDFGYCNITLGDDIVDLPTNIGCYIATCVYASYDCPQVWTLRRYRDNILAKTWYGRAFIHTYYAISPTLVKWFGHTEWFKKMWRGKLDRMVANLQNKGIEATPYEDGKGRYYGN